VKTGVYGTGLHSCVMSSSGISIVELFGPTTEESYKYLNAQK
jgi:hypothetical protein